MQQPPIEIATFSRNEPQHWRDAKDVPLFKNANEAMKTNYHLENMAFQRTEWGLIGSVVALRETMQLVRDRARPDGSNPLQRWPELASGSDQGAAPRNENLRTLIGERWPEFALSHSDCFACHHDLRYPGFRQQRGFGYQWSRGIIRAVPGRPRVRAWPTALLESSLVFTDKQEQLDAFKSKLLTGRRRCRVYEDLRERPALTVAPRESSVVVERQISTEILQASFKSCLVRRPRCKREHRGHYLLSITITPFQAGGGPSG
jgi:hypothetical protein